MKHLIVILLFISSCASAQTAMELFNPAAREYIVGNTPVASNLVHSALEKYPDDEKLQKLKELIEQQQQQQQDQNQQNQDQENEQNQDQQNQDQSDPSESSDQQNEQQQQQEQQPGEQEPQEAQPAPAQPQQAGQMSKEEAQQLLDAMKLNEKDQRNLLQRAAEQSGQNRRLPVQKDW